MAIESITNYLDIPLSHALAAKYGAKLESLTAPDKLTVAQVVLTSIAYWHNDERGNGDSGTIGFVADAYGLVFTNTPNSDDVIALIDAHNLPVEHLFALTTLFCLHLQMGVYANA